jgi:hypothetical protein
MRGKNSFFSEGMVFIKISNGVLSKEKSYSMRMMALTTRTIMKALNIQLESFSIISKNIVAQLYENIITMLLFQWCW